MRFSSGKINNLLGLPANPRPGEFYLIEDGTTTEFYLADSNANLILLASSAGTTGNIVIDEVPTGTINGVNASFTLVTAPITNSIEVFLNGLKLSSPGDYTLAGAVLSMINIPYPGDKFFVNYRY